MARVLVAFATRVPIHWHRGNCLACWTEVYLTDEDVHLLFADQGRPVLCEACAEQLTQKGTVA